MSSIQNFLKDYIVVSEAAKLLKIHEDSLRRLLRTGRIKAMKLGKQWYVHKEELESFASTYIPGPGRKKLPTGKD